MKCAATERKEGERHAGEAGQSERRSGDPRGRRLAVASFARDRHPSTLIARARRMPAGRECNCVNTEGKKSTEVVGRQGEELQDRQVRYDLKERKDREGNMVRRRKRCMDIKKE